jgi:hypothetical protein
MMQSLGQVGFADQAIKLPSAMNRRITALLYDSPRARESRRLVEVRRIFLQTLTFSAHVHILSQSNY